MIDCDIQTILKAAVNAADPLHFLPRLLTLEGERLRAGNRFCNLENFRRVLTVSIGKAGIRMAYALTDVLGNRLSGGIVLTKHPDPLHPLPSRIGIHYGGHPVPTEGSVKGTEAILRLLRDTDEHDLVIFLISGGGSALLTRPRTPVSLNDMRELSSLLLGSGADIKEFNTVRKHLDGVKGGGLGLAAAPAQQISVILSDVVGSPIESIASGPTVADPSTYEEALSVLEKYQLCERVPSSVMDVLRDGMAGRIPETLKTDLGGQMMMGADNHSAMAAARETAEALGFNAQLVSQPLQGEAREVGASLPRVLDGNVPPRSLFVFGGESTVTLRGKGLGGRNLEMALAAVRPLSTHPGARLVTFATDGEDGPTDAAGAVVTADTLSRGLSMGLNPDDFLAENNAYAYFNAVGGLLRPGPTGTNVCDLAIVIGK